MGVELLLADLRRKSAERVAAIRSRTENAAAALRAEQEKELVAARALLAGQRTESERAVAEPITRAAEIQALRIQDDAYRELGLRLYGLARHELAGVRAAGYPAIFAAMVAELPEVSWDEVRVSPQDLALARRHFPGAEIKSDPAITGGFIIESGDGGFRVISTLERRLELAWPFVQPLLLRQIEEALHAQPAD
jgi:vacuolar-type H+-ATPase subunit E/Vma4